MMKAMRWCGALLVAALFAASATAQIPGLSFGSAPAASSTPAASSVQAAATPAKPAPPAALAVEQIAIEAEDATGRLRDIAADIAEDDTAKQVAAQLAPLQVDAKVRLADVRRTLAAHPSIATIHGLESGWHHLASGADEATRELTRRANELGHDLSTLAALEGTWQATASATPSQQTPAELQQRTQDVVALIAKTKADALAKQAEVLALQGRASDLSARASDVLDQLAGASKRALRGLFTRDSLPVWDDGFWSSAIAAVSSQGSESLRAQFSELADFYAGHGPEVALHGVFFVVMLAALFYVRRRLRSATPSDPDALAAVRIFESPVAISLMLACFIGYWIYPQPPQLLLTLISMVGVLPTVFVVRRVIERQLHPMMYAVAAFFVVDRVRNVLAVSAPIARLVFVLEILTGLAYLAWLQMAARQRDDRPWTKERGWRLIRLASVAGLVIGFFALVANIVGYQTLSTLVGGMMVRGAYFALLLYALTCVAQGVVLGAFYAAPFTYLAMVRQHRRLLTDRLTTVIGWIAVFYWCYGMLSSGGLWEIFQQFAEDAIGAQLTLGHFGISLGKIAGFVLAIAGAYWTARFATFVLDEEVYPKINLERGLPYVISTMLRYVILVIGFVVGLALLGIDMTKFTILAGAFSVGLGFGMQNIVNNFVSGLIVLFERPLKVGDVVQFGDVVGRVERIGIRASVIRSANGAEVIIPNGTLIANNLTNWTFSSKTRRIDVPIQTILSADPTQVKAILLDAAGRYAEISKSPEPQALLTKLGPDALEFELRVWTDAASDWASMKSDLTSAVTDELRKAAIAIK